MDGTRDFLSTRAVCILSGISGIVGVLLIGSSFSINTGPQPGANAAEIVAFGKQHFHTVMQGAWLQAVGPWLIIFFALTLVRLAGATRRLSGLMTIFGAGVLMMVSLTEVVFYIAALFSDPATLGLMSNQIAHAVQHLYFMVAAPALFVPLGFVVLGSRVLPRIFGYLALLLGAAFFVLGVTSLDVLILSSSVTSLAAIQALWWFAAAIALMIRSGKIVDATGVSESEA